MVEQFNDALAKVCANIILAQGLSREEALLVVAKLTQKIVEGPVKHTAPSAVDNAPDVAKEIAEEDDSPRAAAPVKENKVLAHPGQSCWCRCGKELYKIVHPVKETMKVADFIAAFGPIGDTPRLTPTVKMQNIDGNIVVDCLKCGKELGVCLIGTFVDGNKGAEPGGVSSVSPDDVGSA